VLLHLTDEPGSYSPPILSALEEGRSALYRDMRFYNDFRILLCTWLYDLRFGTSYRIIKRENHLASVIDGLADLPETQKRVQAKVDSILDKSS